MIKESVLFFSVLPACVLAQDRPNIILFLVDDMGLMDTSLPFLTDHAGNARRFPLNDWYHTPNMERMARSGIRFSTFYAQSVSSPSRVSILTGQNAARHRTTNWINAESNNRDEFGPLAWNWQGIRANAPTLPRMLGKAGYRTIQIGKAHFGPIGSEAENPCRLGFDVSIGGSAIGHPGSYYGENGYGHIRGQKARAVPGLEEYHGTNTFLTDALTFEAMEQMDRAVADGKPFFLYMAHYAVHAPFEADRRFLDHYADGGKTHQAQAFATLIEGMDRSLGELMDYLEKKGIAEKTLILFLGDNGSDSPLGDEKGFTSSAPLRGKKGSEYEGGVRVPFIASWAKPDGRESWQKEWPIQAGVIQQQMGTVMDLYPTLLSLADVPLPKGYAVDGHNLAVQLRGGRDSTRQEMFLMHFPHAHRGSYFTTYRKGDWKLIYYYNPQNPDRPLCELYNLKNDPVEVHNLATEYPGRVSAMVRDMAEELELEGALYPVDANGHALKPEW